MTAVADVTYVIHTMYAEQKGPVRVQPSSFDLMSLLSEDNLREVVTNLNNDHSIRLFHLNADMMVACKQEEIENILIESRLTATRH